MENQTNNFFQSLPEENAIRKIEELYHANYDPDSKLDVYDQLFICEAIAKYTPHTNITNKEDILNKNISLSGSVSDIHKLNIALNTPLDKHQIIDELKKCNYRTPPKKIASLLEVFFSNYPSKPTHWPYIAQTYTPKTINSVINRLVKLCKSGYSIQNPPALFTLIIKRRKKRCVGSKYQ